MPRQVCHALVKSSNLVTIRLRKIFLAQSVSPSPTRRLQHLCCHPGLAAISPTTRFRGAHIGSGCKWNNVRRASRQQAVFHRVSYCHTRHGDRLNVSTICFPAFITARSHQDTACAVVSCSSTEFPLSCRDGQCTLPRFWTRRGLLSWRRFSPGHSSVLVPEMGVFRDALLQAATGT